MKLSVIATLLLSALFSAVSVEGYGNFFTILNPGQLTTTCTGSVSIGNGVFTLSGTSLCVKSIVGGLTGPQTSAKIYGPAAIGSASSVAVATLPLTGVKNTCVTLSSSAVSSLNAGKLYISIATSGCSSGETRGQILPVTKLA